MGTVLALCVGINKYSNYPSSNLQGCVNDANDMAAFIKKTFGDAASVVTLLDEQGTKQSILKVLRDYVLRASAPENSISRIVFSLSGHGTQIADKDGDESDGMDEAFCMSDLNEADGDWDPATVIIDDELSDIFATIPEGVVVDVFLDTCHSGTGLKELSDPMAMLLHRPTRPRCLPSPRVFHAVKNKKRGAKHLDPKTGLIAKSISRKQRAILWAACGPQQTSADAWFRDSSGKFAPGGAFTQTMLKAWKPYVPRAEMMRQIRLAVKKGGYTQVPRLECDVKALKSLPFDNK